MIDRYFDHVDLAEGHKIIIQYESALPAGAPKNAKPEKHAVEAVLVDKDSYPTKLVFGWTIDSNVTKNAGLIQFSVRIYSIVENDDKLELIYSFSTTNSSANILPALNFNLTDKDSEDNEFITPENNANLVLNRIKNSKPSKKPDAPEPVFIIDLSSIFETEADKAAAAVYVKDEEGNDTEEVDYYLYDLPVDTLAATLIAQANADGISNISYEWRHYSDLSQEQEAKGFGATEVYKAFNVANIDYDREKTYYYGLTEESGKVSAYKFVTGVGENETLAEYLDRVSDENSAVDKEHIYQRVSKYSISGAPAEDPADKISATGLYQVTAVNQLAIDNKASIESEKIYIPGPTDPEIADIEVAYKLLDDDKTIELSVDTTIVDGDTATYTWYQMSVDEEGVHTIACSEVEDVTMTENGASLKIDASELDEDALAVFDKNYYVEVFTSRNGDDSESIISGNMRVTDQPHLPVFVDPETEYQDNGKSVKLAVEFDGDFVHTADSITYQWYQFRRDKDENGNFISTPYNPEGYEDKDNNDEPLGEPVTKKEIDLYVDFADFFGEKDEHSGVYYCVVTNTFTINDEPISAKKYTKGYKVIGSI